MIEESFSDFPEVCCNPRNIHHCTDFFFFFLSNSFKSKCHNSIFHLKDFSLVTYAVRPDSIQSKTNKLNPTPHFYPFE